MHFIFDLDGTLINSLPGIADALNTSLSKHGYPTHSLETLRGFIGDGSRMLCNRAVSHYNKDTKEGVIDDIDSSFRTHYAKHWPEGTTIYSGILELLEAIPLQHHISILSNKPHGFTTEIASKMFPEHTFDSVLGQREGIAKKPDPKGIHEIIDQSGHEDTRAFLIGDSTVDLQTAKNAGIGSIAVTWGFEDTEDLNPMSPDHLVDSISELQNLLQTLSL